MNRDRSYIRTQSVSLTDTVGQIYALHSQLKKTHSLFQNILHLIAKTRFICKVCHLKTYRFLYKVCQLVFLIYEFLLLV